MAVSPPRNIQTFLARKANNKTGCSWYSIKNIAKACRLSVSTIKRAIRELLEHNLIKRDYRYRPNGSQTSNLYTILTPAEAGEKSTNPAGHENEKNAFQAKSEPQRGMAGVQLRMENLFKAKTMTTAPEETQEKTDTKEERICRRIKNGSSRFSDCFSNHRPLEGEDESAFDILISEIKEKLPKRWF